MQPTTQADIEKQITVLEQAEDQADRLNAGRKLARQTMALATQGASQETLMHVIKVLVGQMNTPSDDVTAQDDFTDNAWEVAMHLDTLKTMQGRGVYYVTKAVNERLKKAKTAEEILTWSKTLAAPTLNPNVREATFSQNAVLCAETLLDKAATLKDQKLIDSLVGESADILESVAETPHYIDQTARTSIMDLYMKQEFDKHWRLPETAALQRLRTSMGPLIRTAA